MGGEAATNHQPQILECVQANGEHLQAIKDRIVEPCPAVLENMDYLLGLIKEVRGDQAGIQNRIERVMSKMQPSGSFDSKDVPAKAEKRREGADNDVPTDEESSKATRPRRTGKRPKDESRRKER